MAKAAASPQPLTLTADDVDRLLSDKTPATRLDMTDRIGASYNAPHVLSASEVMVAEQIFRLLLRDTEVRVRIALSHHVKDSIKIPRDVVMALARDVEEVSLPVLQYSQVLTDDDLVELVGATEEVSKYIAVSKRKTVSDVVSDVLLAKGNETVATVLVENKGAIISEQGYGSIVENFGGNEKLMTAVTRRPELPAHTVSKLISVVSAQMADTLRKKYKLPAGQIENEIEKTREMETLKLIRMTKMETETDKLVNQLRASGQLTPSIILSALCQGNFDFFETALAKLSAIPVANARKLITDKGDLGFRAIYNKSGLPEAMFPAVKLLLKIVHELDEQGEEPGSPRYANRVVERILQYSEGGEMENLSYIIALVRRIAQ